MTPRAKYERDGYVLFRNVLDPALIHEAGEHVAWLGRKHPDLRPEQYHHWLMRDDPFWVRLVSDERLVDIAAQFVGEDVALFASHYISKPPGDGQPVLWHQDGAYWPLDPMEVVTLWLAVDDADAENGCMRVIPGTHTMDLKKLEKNTQVQSVLGSETPAHFFDESKAVDIALKAGDVSVHHPNIVHGSNANLSTRRRCGLTIRYIPTSTRVTRPDFGALFLLRGKPCDGINDYALFPKFRKGEHFDFSDRATWT